MLVQSGLRSLAVMEQDVFLELVWQFYSNIYLSEEELCTWVQGQIVSLLAALINRVLSTFENGHDLENVITEVQLLPLKDRALCSKEWLLH